MVDRVIIRDESFPVLLSEAIQGQTSEAWNNVVLHCDKGQQIQVNKLVFAAVSEFMATILRDHESTYREDPHIILDEMDINVLKLVVEFAYTGEASIPAALADKIYEASQRLGVKFLQDSFVRLDHEDFEDVTTGRKMLNLQSNGEGFETPVIEVPHESSDTESAESNDIEETVKTGRTNGKTTLQSRKRKRASTSENVLFTITKQIEESAQPDGASYLVKFDNEPQTAASPQVMRPLQLVPGGLMQLVVQRSQNNQPTAGLSTSQPLTLKRPDGTLVQVVGQRPKTQQTIFAPRQMGQVWHPRKLGLPRGVQIQPKLTPTPLLDIPQQMTQKFVQTFQQQRQQQQPITIGSMGSTSPKSPSSSVFSSPSKMAPLTVSEPKPTIPATVPDDFLDDDVLPDLTNPVQTSSERELIPENTAVPEPTVEPVDDSSTRRSGRERKLNKKYLDEEDLDSGAIKSPDLHTEKASLLPSGERKRKPTEEIGGNTKSSKIVKTENIISDKKPDESKTVFKEDKTSSKTPKKIEETRRPKAEEEKNKRNEPKAKNRDSEKSSTTNRDKNEKRSNENSDRSKKSSSATRSQTNKTIQVLKRTLRNKNKKKQ